MRGLLPADDLPHAPALLEEAHHVRVVLDPGNPRVHALVVLLARQPVAAAGSTAHYRSGTRSHADFGRPRADQFERARKRSPPLRCGRSSRRPRRSIRWGTVARRDSRGRGRASGAAAFLHYKRGLQRTAGDVMLAVHLPRQQSVAYSNRKARKVKWVERKGLS